MKPKFYIYEDKTIGELLEKPAAINNRTFHVNIDLCWTKNPVRSEFCWLRPESRAKFSFMMHNFQHSDEMNDELTLQF